MIIPPLVLFIVRLSGAATIVKRFDSHHNQQGLAKTSKLCCILCSACGERKGAVYKCTKCEVAVCVCLVPCFTEYVTNVNL